MNLALSVGAVAETVTVTAEGILVQTTTSAVGKVVDEKQILQLPLSGRNFADLGLLTPGVTTRGQGTSAGTSFYVHGQRNDANNFLLDGVSDNSLEGNALQARPNVDAVQEFKIQTSNFSAEFGRNTGSVVNVVTKSGTNAFTGSGWEFLRSDKFQAKNFFATTSPPPLKFNQYGGTAGGPVVRNKMFFFGSFEGYREGRGQTRQTIVATAQERAGDFSFLTKPLIDPSTGLPFAGNVIPARSGSIQPPPGCCRSCRCRIFPAWRRDRTTTCPRPCCRPITSSTWFARTTRSTTTGRSSTAISSRTTTFSTRSRDPTRPTTRGSRHTTVSRPQHGTGGLNTVVSSGLLNELRFGFSRLTSQGSNLPLLNPVDYGINYVRPQNAIGGLGLPDIEINGISGIGNTVQGPSIGIYQEYELSDVLTAVKGRHNMRIGGTYRPGSEDIDNGFFVVGRYVFNGTYTGDTVADFLLGQGVGVRLRAGPHADGHGQQELGRVLPGRLEASRQSHAQPRRPVRLLQPDHRQAGTDLDVHHQSTGDRRAAERQSRGDQSRNQRAAAKRHVLSRQEELSAARRFFVERQRRRQAGPPRRRRPLREPAQKQPDAAADPVLSVLSAAGRARYLAQRSDQAGHDSARRAAVCDRPARHHAVLGGLQHQHAVAVHDEHDPRGRLCRQPRVQPAAVRQRAEPADLSSLVRRRRPTRICSGRTPGSLRCSRPPIGAGPTTTASRPASRGGSRTACSS